MTVGSRRQVWNGTADKTKGGLTRSDLMLNNTGKIVSKRASKAASKNFKKNEGMQQWNKLVMDIYKSGSQKGPNGITTAMKKAKQQSR